jgi:hypothetical protein
MVRLIAASVFLALIASPSLALAPPSDSAPCGKVESGQITVPEDFVITYREGPHGLAFGRQRTLRVFAAGDFVIEQIVLRGIVPEEEDVKILVKNRISPGRVRRIYARLLACDFFALEQRYDNRDIRGGKQEIIHVTANGKSHSVGVHYFLVRRFSTIRSTIFREVPVVGDYF